MTYLEYPITAVTLLYLMKLGKIETKALINIYPIKFMDRCVFGELSFVTLILIATGVGAWAILVFLESKFISVSWSYNYWDLISPDEFRSLTWSRSWMIADLACVALIAPINEELIFRGLLLNNLLRRYCPVRAILVSSIIFCALHINKNFLGAFLHSVIFSILAIRTSSVYSSIIAHGSYNFLTAIFRAVFGLSLTADILKIDNIYYWTEELILFCFGLIATASYIFLFFRSGRFRKVVTFEAS